MATVLVAALLTAACSFVGPTTPAPPLIRAAASGPAAGQPSPTGPTAAPTAAPTGPAAAPAAAPIVVLDPGHNGANGANPAQINKQVPDGRGGQKACNTTGTETNAGYPEHAFTFDVAQQVAQRLTGHGVTVVLTRSNDTGVGPCVDVRGRAGPDANANAVVSIHADGAAADGRGFHVAYSDPPLDPVQAGPALELAKAVRGSMRDAGFPTSTYTGSDGLAPRSDLAGLNFARRPAVLIECANMRNPAEAELVSSPAGRARYADAITGGILAFLGR